jgi:SAM-dependent methyltransferase
MTFYDMLSSSYDDLFPYDTATADFILSHVPSLKTGGRVLDIGCATGSLALDLASRGASVDAIDLDAAMIEKASGRGSSVNFSATDMRTIASIYKANTFDAVVCAGNTIAHLPDAASAGEFLAAMNAVLKEGGKAFIQTVNFDLVAEGRFPGFPVIERAGLRFERSYRSIPGSKHIVFAASITDSTGKKTSAETQLYALSRFELSALAFRAGFGVVESFSGFGGEPMTDDSMYCLQIAEKRSDCH